MCVARPACPQLDDAHGQDCIPQAWHCCAQAACLLTLLPEETCLCILGIVFEDENLPSGLYSLKGERKWLHTLLAGRPWASHLASLGLTFLTWKRALK